MTEKQNILTGLSVQVATPFGDGKADIEYVLSAINTFKLLETMGAKIDWARLPGCSDLPMARSKIFGSFLRSQHTHLLMVDSDMGWDAGDVLRLLMLKRDFIGGVGCKKKDNLEFALNNCDDRGNVFPIQYEADTGVMDISEVGMAFMLISKACAEKMAAHYEDLLYDYGDGIQEYDVFSPFIIPGTKRRLAEDFAFCYRWRRIGGKVQILPYIRLQHCGKSIWEAALSDTFPQGGCNGGEKKESDGQGSDAVQPTLAL